MKKIVFGVSMLVIASVFLAFNLMHNNGMLGASGSPGEGTCANCHGGGPAGTTVSITSTPAFSSNNYVPGTNYTVNITVSHPTLPAFGFDAEILTSGNSNAGLMANAGNGVKFGLSGTRNNATHTTPKSGSGGASFTFEWMAPSSGPAIFYIAGNAVNLNGNESGDAVANTSITLNPSATGIAVNALNVMSEIILSPNPANDISTLSYNLLSSQTISVDLIDISGKLVKNLVNERGDPGYHTHTLDLRGIEKGIYFVKTTANGKKVSQKLISVI